MLTLFLKLLLSHLLGDFLLQPKKWVQKRKEHVGYLFVHVLVHAVVLMLLFYNDLNVFWSSILFIVMTHLAIDSLKIWWEKLWPYQPVFLFLLDQLLHIAVLIGVVFYEYGVPDQLPTILLSNQMLMYCLAFLLVAVVSPIFLRIFFTKWTKEQDMKSKQINTLMDAGLLIGIMERLIIVLFIQVGFLSGIGFLLAAKSIFRFGDLSNAKDTKFTEYVLVGTFASFIIAIVIGYLLRIGLTYA